MRPLASGLTPRAVLEKLCAMQMVDVHLPTTDGHHLILPRYTQPPPRITTTAENPNLAAAIL